jgi:hypothetical protein
MLDKKVAMITCQANKRIEMSQLEVERFQQDCAQQASAAVKRHRSVLTMTLAHATEIKKLKHEQKSALRDMQARHALRYEKQKLCMSGNMNRLHELLFGQNEIIDGCLDEMRDEPIAA